MGTFGIGSKMEASFAAISASSFPEMPEWPGIHTKMVSWFLWRSVERISAAIECCLIEEFSILLKAVSESEHIRDGPGFVDNIVFKHSEMAKSSAEKMENVDGRE